MICKIKKLNNKINTCVIKSLIVCNKFKSFFYGLAICPQPNPLTPNQKYKQYSNVNNQNQIPASHLPFYSTLPTLSPIPARWSRPIPSPHPSATSVLLVLNSTPKTQVFYELIMFRSWNYSSTCNSNLGQFIYHSFLSQNSLMSS